MATDSSPPSKIIRQKSGAGNGGPGTPSTSGPAKRSAHYILGIDVGTTSVKISLVDMKTGEPSEKFTKDTMAGAVSDHGHMADLQDPGKIYSALHACMTRVSKEKLKRVGHIAICGQMHGVIFWKHTKGWSRNHQNFDHVDMGEVSSLYTWQDGRCDQTFLASLPSPDSQLRVSTGYGCATIFWLQRHRPEFLENYDRCGTIMDFLVAMLTENETVLMSSHNAASWGYFDTVEKRWNTDILQENDFPVDLLPSIVDAGTDAGNLLQTWFFIPDGTPITSGMGDLQCSVRSTVIDPAIDAILNISTSAQMAFVKSAAFKPEGKLDESHVVEYLPYFQGRYLAVAASLTGGNALAAFVKMLQHWVVDLGLSIPQSKIWEKVVALGGTAAATSALQVPVSSNGVASPVSPSDPGLSPSCASTTWDPIDIVPTLFGERHEPDKKASASNINLSNLGLGQVTFSICHGIVRNLASMMPPEVLFENGLTRIVGSGACLTRNPALKAQVQEIYKLPILFVEEGSACIGAALAVRDLLLVQRKRVRSDKSAEKSESPS